MQKACKNKVHQEGIIEDTKIYKTYTIVNALRDIGNTIRLKLVKSKEIVINMLRKVGNMIKRIPKPKYTFHKSLELARFAIMAESFMQWRRGQLASSQLLLPIVAILSISKFIEYYHKHYLEREWDIVYELTTDKTKEQFKKQETILNLIIGLCYFCGIYPGMYMDKPFVVYSAYKVVIVLGLVMQFEDDKLLWRITMGNRISVDDLYKICKAVNKELYPRRSMDVLDIKYFFCDSLRRGLKLNTVKALLQIYPDYINIDRDGIGPFELACKFSSADTVQYMVESDDTFLDHRDEQGNSPLHWVCQRRTGSLNVVNYLLEKRMSLVTLVNKDGDLPIHLASDKLINWYQTTTKPAIGIEIVWRLLLAYPECLSCVGESTNGSNEEDIDDNKKNR